MKLGLLGLAMGLPPTGVVARPTSPPLARDLLSHSDAVIVGRVASEIDLSPWPRAVSDYTMFSQTAVIDVAAVLEGPTSLLTHKLAIRVQSFRRATRGAFAIFFLKNTPDRTIVNANPNHWTLPALQELALRSKRAADPLAGIAREMVAILRASKNEVADPGTGVNYVDDGAGSDFLEHAYARASVALVDVPSELIVAPLGEAERSGDPLTRLWATQCLMSHGIFDGLPKVTSLLMKSSPETHLAVSEVAFELDDPKLPSFLTPALLGLLSSLEPEVRGAAAQALGRNNAAGAVAPLVSLMQVETDVDALHQEADGLCRLVHSPSRACAQVTYVGWPVKPPPFWRKWAEGQLNAPGHDPNSAP